MGLLHRHGLIQTPSPEGGWGVLPTLGLLVHVEAKPGDFTYSSPMKIDNTVNADTGKDFDGYNQDSSNTSTDGPLPGQKAVTFNGIDEYWSINDSSMDTVPTLYDDFAVCFWAYHDGGTGYLTAASWNASATEKACHMGFSPNSLKIFYRYADSGGIYYDLYSPVMPDVEGWHHVVIQTKRSSAPFEVRMYYDSVLVATESLTDDTFYSSAPYWVGRTRTGYYQGILGGSYQLYAGVILDQDDVDNIYNLPGNP